jgi:hypothetical protein
MEFYGIVWLKMRPAESCDIVTVQDMEDAMMQIVQKLKYCNVDSGGQPYLMTVKSL